MSSSFRTRSHRASPASSSRRCKLPRPRVRLAARRTISPPTTSICAAMRWFGCRQGKSPRALRLMGQAIARDPRYGPALAWAAYCCYRLLHDGRSENRAEDRLKGVDFARRALETAGDDPGVLANAALALAYFGEDIGAMMALVDRALALNP